MDTETSFVENLNNEAYMAPECDYYDNVCHLVSLKPGQSNVQLRTLFLNMSELKPFVKRSTQETSCYTTFFVHDGKNFARGVAFGDDAQRLYAALKEKECYFVTLKNVQTKEIDERYSSKGKLPYEISFHQYSDVTVLQPKMFSELKGLKDWTPIPRLRGILAGSIQQQPDNENVRFAGTLIDMERQHKVEVFFEFEPEKYPVGATLVIKFGKILNRSDAVMRLYVKEPAFVKQLNVPIYNFDEFDNINLIPFP